MVLGLRHIEVRLGDKMNGFLAEETLTSTIEIIPWLLHGSDGGANSV